MKEISRSNPFTISIIFSFRNEEDVLPELIRRVRYVLDEEQLKGIISSYELIFVNDDSTDNSLSFLLEQSRDCRSIRVINMSRRFGVSPCVLAGMHYASGDAVVYMDADLQDPPEVIPELIDIWRKNNEVDVVHTVRQSRKGESKGKLLITRLGYLILNKLSSTHLPIEAGDFKLLSRRAVNHLICLREKNPYLRGLVCWIGFKQIYVKYHRGLRFAGKTKFRIVSPSVINNFFGSALISFSSAPLKLALVLGFGAIVLDFFIVGHVFIEKFSGRAVPGWTALMMVVLFMGGVQLFCMGMTGLYINNIFKNSQERPNYIIESTHGFLEKNHRSSLVQANEKIETPHG